MLTAFTVYLTIHLTVYVLWLRHLAILRTEKGIFLYHFASAAITVVVAVIAAFINPIEFGIAGCFLILSVHGIYSLSFLELWSLAQGGYSLTIISGIAQAKVTGTELDLFYLAAIGESKQADRVASMERLNLISIAGESITLTPRGSAIAAAMHALRCWVDPSDHHLD